MKVWRKNMNFVDVINDVHQTALAHGWWDDGRESRETIALIHSELSEALEEARKGTPMMYSNPEKPEKMEGVAVELIDCVIRMFDFMGRYDIPYIAKSERPVYATPEEPLPILVCKLHAVISSVFGLALGDSTDVGVDIDNGDVRGVYDVGWCFSNATDMIFGWLREHGVSPESVLHEKAEYNKTRPYKHGKKF